MSSAQLFYHLRVHQSADSSREDQAHEGGLRGGRGGDPGTMLGEIVQGTYGNWMPTYFFCKVWMFPWGSWLLTPRL